MRALLLASCGARPACYEASCGGSCPAFASPWQSEAWRCSDGRGAKQPQACSHTVDAVGRHWDRLLMHCASDYAALFLDAPTDELRLHKPKESNLPSRQAVLLEFCRSRPVAEGPPTNQTARDTSSGGLGSVATESCLALDGSWRLEP